MELSTFDQNKRVIDATVNMRLEACKRMVACYSPSGHVADLAGFVAAAKLHRDAASIAARHRHK